MPKPNIRPWRDLVELLSVRQLLYSNDDAEQDARYDEQRLGVNIVNTWKRRCRVPHSIYSTAVLVDAKLHHNVEESSTFAIRAVYSTAFARFVTGFCDMGQNSVVKRSMYEMADLIGMPEAWVELRHDITHGQIPDLRTLETYVQDSLVWLWDFFWNKLDVPQADTRHEPSAKAEIRDTLKSFLRNRRNEIKQGLSGKAVVTAATDALHQLLRVVKKPDINMPLLVSVLVEEKMMIPSQKQIEMNMKTATLIWDALLQSIASNRPAFYSSIVNHLLDELTTPSITDPNYDTLKAAKFQWLVHLVTARKWGAVGVSQHDMQTQIAETSLLNPTTWSQKLVKAIIDRAENDFKQLWAPLYEASALETSMEDIVLDVAIESDPPDLVVKHKIDPEVKSKKKRVKKDTFTSSSSFTTTDDSSKAVPDSPPTSPNRGWKMWEGGWVPKPIGG